jgi:hypothetical protein
LSLDICIHYTVVYLNARKKKNRETKTERERMIYLTKKADMQQQFGVDTQLTYNHRKKRERQRKGEKQSSVHHYQRLEISSVFILFFSIVQDRERERGGKEHRRNYSSTRYHSLDRISHTSSEGGVSSSLHFVFTFVS